MVSFSTKADAVAAGFTSHRAHEFYRGFVICSRDSSGSNSFGYSFRVDVSLDSQAVDILDLINAGVSLGIKGNFGQTVSVWLSDDLNAIRQPGCLAVLYAPGVWAAGVEAARRAIDAWYAANPAASKLHCEWAQWRAECDVRQAAKRARRAARRAAL